MADASIDICDFDPQRIAVRADYRLKDSIKRVPGARWSSEHRIWTVPLTWPSCLALRSELGRSLKIEPSLNSWAKAQRVHKQKMLDIRAQYLDGVELDGSEYEGLYPYQCSGGLAIATSGGYGLFDETGTGKSRTSLAGIRLAMDLGDEVFPLLIVAPKSMLITWARDEVPRFFPDADIRVAAGTPSTIRKALTSGGDVYVISYDTLRRYSRLAYFHGTALKDDQKVEKELNSITWRSVIADEAHRAKNPQSQQTRALWHVGKDAHYRVALTGSPIQDTPEDLWAVFRFIAPDEYPTKTSFVERYLEVTWNIWGGREIRGINPIHQTEFEANAHTRFRRVTKELVLKFLPPKIQTVRWVELPPRMRKAYEDMKEAMIAELESGETLAAKSVLERAGRLLQFANAAGEMVDERYRMALPSPKIEAFMEDVADGDYDGQSVVVYSDSRQLIDLLSSEMTRKKIKHTMITGSVTGDDRQLAMDEFQSGAVRFLLCTRAGGEGVTLTAASTMVRLIRSWSFIAHSQSEDRVHRIGSEIHSSVTYVDYITQDTVELGQLARLNEKRERATDALGDKELLELLKS